MEIQTLVRTAAIIYSDELGSSKTDKIQRKIIESIYVLNENAALSMETLLQEIECNYQLKYEEDEVKHLLNSTGAEFSFDDKYEKICLKDEKFQKLKLKEGGVDPIVEKFLNLKKQYAALNPIAIIYRFLYELLNTNIDAYNGLLGNRSNIGKSCTVDSTKFNDDEISLINDFLAWDNKEKNQLLFKLISFSIEYSLVSNNKKGSVIENALNNKIFYLDLNVVFRAIGINGLFRKQRVEYFLKKCKEFGQKLAISSYTIEEFYQSIDYHIGCLSSIPYGKSNPELFSIAGNNYGFYQYYAEWRKDRSAKNLTTFKEHLASQLDVLCEKFCIERDYKHQLKELEKNVQRTMQTYKEELTSFKSDTSEKNINVDVKNVIMIENCRGSQNVTFQETKYYLLSSDQKLKAWDKQRSIGQYVVMLPSCWMGLILKYYSRSEEDYTSYLSFLKLPANEPVLNEQELEKVVAAISEYTEDFQSQKEIMEKIVERKFSDVINGAGDVIRENVLKVSKDCIEEKYANLIEKKDEKFEQLKKKAEIQHLRDSIELKKRDLKDEERNREGLKKTVDSLECKARRKSICRKVLVTIVVLVICAFVVVAAYKWNFFEGPVWGVCSFFVLVLFIINVWTKKKLVLQHVLKKWTDENQIKENLNKKHGCVNEKLKDCLDGIKKLQSELNNLNQQLKHLENQ